MPQNIEGYKSLIVFAILGIVIAMAIVIFSNNCCTVKIKEGFNDTIPALTSCPSNTKTFYDKESNISCCNGTVNGNTCEGTIVCSFSSSTSKSYPSCKVLLQSIIEKRKINRSNRKKLRTQEDVDKCMKKCKISK